SHAVNPSVREYRRASATCIDASLKPLMGEYLEGMSARLRTAGFAGAMMVVTSQGGVMEAGDIARAPIHAVKSGPAMAPVAGRAYAMAEGGADTAIVAEAACASTRRLPPTSCARAWRRRSASASTRRPPRSWTW